jgi:uncharacterized protein YndB with AHSA1/START domain
MSAPRDLVSVERIIAAPAAEIFALLADPRRHKDIDGSGTVREAKDLPPRLELGAKFGMSMHRGIGYSMTNTVVEYEQDRRIAWQPRPGFPLSLLVGGRIWRYELEPVEGGTRVTETWDIRKERVPALVRRDADNARRGIEGTLDRIASLVAQQENAE